MTRKLEQEFNLPSMEELKELSQQEVVEVGIDAEAVPVPATEVVTTALTNAEKIDSALPQVNDVNKHDGDMEDIAGRAMDSYEELMSLGMNVQDAHAGRIFETAGKMLQIAMDSKNAKVDKKLRTSSRPNPLSIIMVSPLVLGRAVLSGICFKLKFIVFNIIR